MTRPTSDAIARIAARQVFDSRGIPTVEVDVELQDGNVGRASVPSGASTGRHEVCELRDGESQVYEGRGVRRAVDNVLSQISKVIIGTSSSDQLGLDQRLVQLDGTPNLSRLGANAILATSLAVCRAAAAHLHLSLYRYIGILCHNSKPELPMPMVNILSGGAHAFRSMDFQDFLAVPVAAQSFSEAMQVITRVRRSAEQVAIKRGLSAFLADEGGLSPGLKSVEGALDLMVEAIEVAGLIPVQDVGIAIDVAASELFTTDLYDLQCEGRRVSGEEMVSMIANLVGKYPIISVEDALDEDDWENWTKLTATIPHLQIVGDDLFATNSHRIGLGIERAAANAVLIKLNQNGTLSGTLEAMDVARRAGFANIVSARSGETEDPFIADLAVGTRAGQIKVGSLRTSERLSKYNQLLRIEEDTLVSFSRISGLRGRRPQSSPLQSVGSLQDGPRTVASEPATLIPE